MKNKLEVGMYCYNKTNRKINYLNNEELQAIFKICKELGWNK